MYISKKKEKNHVRVIHDTFTENHIPFKHHHTNQISINKNHLNEKLILNEINSIEDKFIVLITSCHKNMNKRNILINRFNKLGLPYFIIYGNPEMEYGKIGEPLYQIKNLANAKSASNGVNQIENELHINVSDHYDGLTFKNFYAINYIYQNYPNVNILKMDDDTEILDYLTFKNYLKIFVKNKYDYAGNYNDKPRGRGVHCGRSKDESWNKNTYKGNIVKDFCSGACTLLSNNSIKYISEYFINENNRKMVLNEIYDDRLFAGILQIYNIRAVHFNFYLDKTIKWN
jgi:hypothetical protein